MADTDNTAAEVRVVNLDEVTDAELQALADACDSDDPDTAWAVAYQIDERLDPDPDVPVRDLWSMRLVGLGAEAELENRRIAGDPH